MVRPKSWPNWPGAIQLTRKNTERLIDTDTLIIIADSNARSTISRWLRVSFAADN